MRLNSAQIHTFNVYTASAAAAARNKMNERDLSALGNTEFHLSKKRISRHVSRREISVHKAHEASAASVTLTKPIHISVAPAAEIYQPCASRRVIKRKPSAPRCNHMSRAHTEKEV